MSFWFLIGCWLKEEVPGGLLFYGNKYNMDRETKLKIRNLEKEIQDLKVVIDTCQSTLRSAQSHLKKYPEDHDAVFNVPSAKWVLSYQL